MVVRFPSLQVMLVGGSGDNVSVASASSEVFL